MIEEKRRKDLFAVLEKVLKKEKDLLDAGEDAVVDAVEKELGTRLLAAEHTAVLRRLEHLRHQKELEQRHKENIFLAMSEEERRAQDKAHPERERYIRQREEARKKEAAEQKKKQSNERSMQCQRKDYQRVSSSISQTNSTV